MNRNRNKVLLINPHHHRNWMYGQSIFSFSIGILYIAAYLKKSGFQPFIVDTCVDSDYLEQIKSHLPDTLYAGISAMTPQVSHGMEIARFIHSETPDIPLVWDGIHPFLYPDSCRDPHCDIAVLEEGDETAVNTAENLKSNRPLCEIHGIAFAESDTVCRTVIPDGFSSGMGIYYCRSRRNPK